MSHKAHTTIEVTSEHSEPHDEAVLRDPHFMQLHLEIAQAISTYVAAKMGQPAPKISAKIIGIHHEKPAGT